MARVGNPHFRVAFKLARFRGHFPHGGEGSTNGQKAPQSYPLDFRRELDQAGRSLGDLPPRSDSPSTIRSWVKEADLGSGWRGDHLVKLQAGTASLTCNDFS
jgi:hypothetical protein